MTLSSRGLSHAIPILPVADTDPPGDHGVRSGVPART